ncbi:MAG: RNA polymerase sigma factor [Thermoleophilaceae bacterium]|nr:RNA polymerase sigma factor [Thermoleophilaceae bacterium]
MEAFTAPRRAALALPRSARLLSALPDETLVAQARRGNESAFEAIYDRHHGGILSFCRHMLGSPDDGEDALQQTFISAYGDMAKDDRELKLKPWLYAIARNKCLSILRARRTEPSDAIEVATAGLADDVQSRADLREVLQDLEKLPDEQREALVLSELGDLSHTEVGDVIGCEASKVKSLVFQARSSLMDSRKARETPCAEIREQLSTLRGGALRRGHLRRHVKACPGCSEFQDEVSRQRAAMAMVLPVVPTLGLKESVVAAVGIGKGAAAAGGAATAGLSAAGASATVAKGGMVAGLAAKTGATKLAVVALAGAATVGGVAVTEHELSKPDTDRTAQREAALQEKGAKAPATPPPTPVGAAEETIAERRAEKRAEARAKAKKRAAKRRAALRRAGIVPGLTKRQKERRVALRRAAVGPAIERVRKGAKVEPKAKSTPEVKKSPRIQRQVEKQVQQERAQGDRRPAPKPKRQALELDRTTP